nr:hypothetical protein [Shigella sonnei]
MGAVAGGAGGAGVGAFEGCFGWSCYSVISCDYILYRRLMIL